MRVSLVLLVVGAGCHETRHCSMPGDHETQPAEPVELPPVSLAGFTQISTDDPSVSREEAGAAIDKALGGDGTFVDQTEWHWQGGAVYFTTPPLSLRYDDDRMHARTIYGLPNCGVN